MNIVYAHNTISIACLVAQPSLCDRFVRSVL